MTPRVSILIPACNGERFLAECVESVRAQTMPDWEALLVDDGSVDGTWDLLQQLAAAEPRLRIFRQANAGTQAARNTALAQARGEWVALLDQDDVWLPRKLEAQLGLLNEHPRANLLFTNYHNWDGEVKLGARYTKPHRFPAGDVRRQLTRWCLFQACTVMVRRPAAQALGGFAVDLPLAGDWDMWLRIAEPGVDARGTWEPLALYRLWEGNESRKVLAMAEEKVRVVERALERPQAPALARAYRSSLRLARSDAALACLASHGVLQLRSQRGLAWEAWRRHPLRLKNLLLWGGVALPVGLGGQRTAALVHGKLRRKWGVS